MDALRKQYAEIISKRLDALAVGGVYTVAEVSLTKISHEQYRLNLWSVLTREGAIRMLVAEHIDIYVRNV